MRGAFRQAAVLLLLALAPAVTAAFFHPKKPAWRSDETTLGLAEAMQPPPLWIDARPRADYDRKHVPGALPLREDDWNALLPTVLDAWNLEQPVIVYCSSSSCQASREVARRLREEVGLNPVYVLRGGWEAWEHAHR